MRAIAACLSPSLTLPRLTWRTRLRSIVSTARSSATGSTSPSRTLNPASAHTWAMPLPIWPAPITPIVFIMIDPIVCSLTLGQLGVELRHQLEEVADEAVIGDLEDRRLLVLVYGDDDLGILHPGEMLDGAGNADRDIEIGGDDLAGLADLVVVGHEAGIDGGAAC